jgi:hypothetical protein
MDIEVLNLLVRDGKNMLANCRSSFRGVSIVGAIGSDFIKWQCKSLEFLEHELGPGSIQYRRFSEQVSDSTTKCLGTGVGILESIDEYTLKTAAANHHTCSAINRIVSLFSRYHLVANQLLKRHGARNTITIGDEYDVQDLLHALLMIWFDDIRPEEYSPSYAGGSSRIDFVIKQERIAIETKMARPGLDSKKIGEELIVDIAKYKTHQDCAFLACFVYDPNGVLKNPRGIEKDLSSSSDSFGVGVYICPVLG